MKVYYFQSANENALLEIAKGHNNVIGPKPGIPAYPSSTDEDGIETPATEAVGDPALWYMSIKTNSDVTAHPDVTECGLETGIALLGVWA